MRPATKFFAVIMVVLLMAMVPVMPSAYAFDYTNYIKAYRSTMTYCNANFGSRWTQNGPYYWDLTTDSKNRVIDARPKTNAEVITTLEALGRFLYYRPSQVADLETAKAGDPGDIFDSRGSFNPGQPEYQPLLSQACENEGFDRARCEFAPHLVPYNFDQNCSRFE